MKAQRFFIIALFMIVSLTTIIIGCKYDVAEPLWSSPPSSTAEATITSVVPAQAPPGVNYITIYGTNFTGVTDTSLIHILNTGLDTNMVYQGVYFDKVLAEIIESSSTFVKVRRPNLTTENCTVKVIPNKAYVGASAPFGKIDTVVEAYGAFLDNVSLSVVAVDSAENLYVVETSSSHSVYKITPTGQKTKLGGGATRTPTDARIGPDGRLYLPGKNAKIDVVNVTTGVVATWTTLPSAPAVKFGDFGANGYFYTGGLFTDLIIVAPNPPLTNPPVTKSGVYATSDILAIRVANGYLYIAAKKGTNTSIWKHLISAGVNQASQELVLDWSSTGQFATRTIKNIAISADGTLYIGTADLSPILIVTTQGVDFFYKGILPDYCQNFAWGSGNFLYMISGNAVPAQKWIIYRVDMGAHAQ